MSIDLGRHQRGVPARMVVVTAAGPVANLTAAVATAAVAAMQSMPAELRVVALGLTAAGVLMAIGNLAPYKLSSTTASDGLAMSPKPPARP